MAIFIDVFYPGNADRKNRIDEVTADCSSLLADAATTKDRVEKKLSASDEVIRDAYSNIAMTPPKLEEVNLTSKWKIYVPEVILDGLGSEAAVCALRWAWANHLVRVGTVTAEQLAELGVKGVIKIAVPKWLRIVGGGGAAIVAAVVVDMLVDSIAGATQRSELQKGIREITEARVGMKRVDMLNQELENLLDSVIMSFNAIKAMGLPAPVIEQMLKSLLDQNKISRDSITRAEAAAALVRLDKTRGSWTKEDGDWAKEAQSNGVRLLSSAPLGEVSPLQMATNAIHSLSIPQEQRQLILTRVQKLA